MDFDPSCEEIRKLLVQFLEGTQGVSLDAPILDIKKSLPRTCLKLVCDAIDADRPWIAWSSIRGPMAASGEYDTRASQRLQAHVLRVTWCIASSGRHQAWCHCYSKRPCEWIFGREAAIRDVRTAAINVPILHSRGRRRATKQPHADPS
jgi:hypothetical protein